MDQHQHLSTKPRTRVRVACDRCGVQQLPAAALTLRCCEDDGETTVRYACSRCGLVHVEPVDDHQAAALARSDDVRFEPWRRPVESPTRPGAPSFGDDEVDDWLTLLDDDETLLESLEVLASELTDTESAEEADRT